MGYYIIMKLRIYSFTENDIMSTEHILLPNEVFNSVNEFFTKTSHAVLGWSNGDIGSSIWESHMIPKLKSTDVLLEEGQWKSAMGELMGMLWFMTWYDAKQYTHTMDSSKWFVNYNSSWKILLCQKDDVLGLAISGGRDNGYYRQQLQIQLNQLNIQYHARLIPSDDKSDDKQAWM